MCQQVLGTELNLGGSSGQSTPSALKNSKSSYLFTSPWPMRTNKHHQTDLASWHINLWSRNVLIQGRNAFACSGLLWARTRGRVLLRHQRGDRNVQVLFVDLFIVLFFCSIPSDIGCLVLSVFQNQEEDYILPSIFPYFVIESAQPCVIGRQSKYILQKRKQVGSK